MAMSARQFEQVFRRANATIALVQNPATRPQSIAVTFDGRITVLEFVPNDAARKSMRCRRTGSSRTRG